MLWKVIVILHEVFSYENKKLPESHPWAEGGSNEERDFVHAINWKTSI